MIEIIEALRKGQYFGAGEFTEIAKGKYELVKDFKTLKRKANRLWQSRKKLKL